MLRKELVLIVLMVSSLGLFAQANFTVCTYNVKSFEGDPILPNKKSFEMSYFIEALKPLDLDLIGINELEILTSRTGPRDLLAELGNGLGMYSVFGRSYIKEEGVADYPDGLYGNGLLSRYPIIYTTSRELVKPAGSSDQRSILIADVLHPSGTIVRVAVTHLDHEAGQFDQMEDIISDKMIAESPYSVILMGDFNATFYYSSMQDILGPKFDVVSDITQGSFKSHSVIDYILATPKGAWQVVQNKTYYNITYSDHYPVVAEITLKQ